MPAWLARIPCCASVRGSGLHGARALVQSLPAHTRHGAECVLALVARGQVEEVLDRLMGWLRIHRDQTVQVPVQNLELSRGKADAVQARLRFHVVGNREGGWRGTLAGQVGEHAVTARVPLIDDREWPSEGRTARFQ